MPMEDKKYRYQIYTPTEVAKFIAKRGIDLYFEKKTKSLETLRNIRICDLSCGNGNLLIPALEILLSIHYELTGRYEYIPQWICGYDINPQGVKLAKSKIREVLKKYSLKEEQDINIFCENSLLSSGKFNIVLGNPPYLGEKNNKEIFCEIKKTEFGKRYYEARMDYFYFFIEKGIELLDEGGILVYLTTNYWLKADSGKKLRETIKNFGSFREIYLYDSSLFKKAQGQHNIIFSWEKKKFSLDVKISLEDEEFTLSSEEIFDENNNIILAKKEVLDYFRCVREKANYKLGDLVNINQGIISGLDRAYVFSSYNKRFEKYLKPFYKSKDIGKYTNTKNEFWILYLDRDTPLEENLLKYLEPFKKELTKRREVVYGRIEWWQLQWAREKSIFYGSKILVRQRANTNKFSYDEGEFFGSADIYFITPKNKDINIYYILGYMNSAEFLKWFKYNGKSKGKNYEFYSTPLKQTPIYYPDEKSEIEYIEKFVKSQILRYNENVQKKIDEYFSKIFKI